MPLINDIRDDIREANKIRLPWWLLLSLVVASLPVYWLFDHFGRLSTSLPTLNSVLVLGFILVLKWKLRRHVWFWITMAILALLHVPLVLFVPWSAKWIPATAIAAIDSADLIAMLAILAVVGGKLGDEKL